MARGVIPMPAKVRRGSGLIPGVALGVLWILGAGAALAQEAPPQEAPPQDQPLVVPRAESEAGAGEARPGRYRIGPLYFTPSFRVGTIGFDSNVFYTATERRADFTASGGPALDVVLPVRGAWRLRGTGAISYLYFVRTPSQRRLNGSGEGWFERTSQRSGLRFGATYQRDLARPSLEVDRRVLSTAQSERVELWQRLFARTTLRLTGEHTRRELDPGEIQLGVDLRRALSQQTYTARGDLGYSLTAKTSVAATAERVAYRMLYDERRDADVDRVLVGLRADATALISGEAMVGPLWFRPRDASFSSKRWIGATVDATLNLSLKTHIGGFYQRQIGYSALATTGTDYTLLTQSYGAKLDKDLIGNLNLQLMARRSLLAGQGRIVLTLPDGSTVEGRRDDTADEAMGDLGYRFRSRLRIGVAASYVTRQSSLSYFGIRGLVVGLTVKYAP